MVVWDIVKNSEKKIILRSMRSGEILCTYGAKEKNPGRDACKMDSGRI